MTPEENKKRLDLIQSILDRFDINYIDDLRLKHDYSLCEIHAYNTGAMEIRDLILKNLRPSDL